MERGTNVLALIKRKERYVFLYDDDSLDKTLQTMGEYAADPELSFTWYDAAILSQRIAKMREKIQGSLEQRSRFVRQQWKEEH